LHTIALHPEIQKSVKITLRNRTGESRRHQPPPRCSHPGLWEGERTPTYLSQDLVQGLQNELHKTALGTARWGLFSELAAVGGQSRDMRSKHSAACNHLCCKHSLCSPQAILCSLPTSLGSSHGHRGHAYPRGKPEEALCSRLGESAGPRGFTPSRRPDSTLPRYYSITGQLRLEGTLDGHLVHVLQGKEGKNRNNPTDV